MTLRREVFLRALSPGLAAIGAAVRLREYFSNRSLWLDEAMLAQNILRRGYADLLKPLDRFQEASAPGAAVYLYDLGPDRRTP